MLYEQLSQLSVSFFFYFIFLGTQQVANSPLDVIEFVHTCQPNLVDQTSQINWSSSLFTNTSTGTSSERSADNENGIHIQ